MDYLTVFADAVWFAANMGETIRILFIENHLEPENSVTPGVGFIATRVKSMEVIDLAFALNGKSA